MDYALDTNTIIHLMRGTPSVKSRREQAVRQGARLIIPPFADYEIQRGLIIKPTPEHIKAYSIICDNCILEDMPSSAWQRAAQIYAQLYTKRFTVKDADIIIAAFCMVNNYTLVTNNIADFANIDGLLMIDWV